MNLVNEGVLPPDELDDRDERREEQESARSRETFADIVADLRKCAKIGMDFAERIKDADLKYSLKSQAENYSILADRIEATARRAYNEIDRAAPARQCDIGTPEEQLRRFAGSLDSVKCDSIDIKCAYCALRWAHMPYKAEE